MRWFRSRKRPYEQQLEDELRFHIDQQARDYIAAGVPPNEANRRAALEFGGASQIKEECREAASRNPIPDLTADIRFGIRQLRKRPGFTSVAIVALALGIGANSAVFSVVNAVLLRPLSFPDLDRLVEIRISVSPTSAPVADYLDWKSRATSFQHMSAYAYDNFHLGSDGSDPAGVFGAQITTDLLTTLGTKPAHGRDFSANEENVAFISDTLWKERFAADTGVLGKSILIDRKPHVVVGILPPDFDFPLPRVAVWTPFAFSAEERADRSRPRVHVVAQLKDGVSLSAAAAEMDLQTRRLSSEHPATNADRRTRLVLFRERQIEFSGPFLALLQAAAAFVLLIACANLANLQLAHGMARTRELAVRAALGAGRWRVARLLLIESLILALAGGIAGVAVAYAGVELIKAGVPADTARSVVGWSRVALHIPVLAFTFGIAVLAGVLFGVSSAWRAARVQLTDSLKEGSLQGGAKSALRPALVVAEVMLAVIAVVGATQTARGFQAMFDIYGGFTPEQVLAIRLTLPHEGYATPQAVSAFLDRAAAEAASLPQVQAATVTTNLPGSLTFNPNGRFELEGKPPLRDANTPRAEFQFIGPDYFRALRIHVRSGRAFTDQDGESAPSVAVINQRLASRFWPGENPIGKRISVFHGLQPESPRTIIGVVADVQQFWFQQEPRPLIYLPYRQAPPRQLFLALRTHGDPMAVLPAIRERIAAIDPALPLYEPRPMNTVLQETMSAMRMTTGMMTLFGILALVLAAFGVYGVVAYSVTQRRREFSIRMALGARPGVVLRMVLRQALTIAGVGCALGLASGILVSRAMSGIMYGTGTQNIAALVGAPLLLAAISLLASWLPARSGMQVDPAVVLRQE
ncbi:MAG TPA: ABC transporter permease [Bryobacteraceae bacterium]|nr:ABC transporter permease [Bryobacteraceae bacterium]